MKTLLATVGLGFVGSHTCVSLIENNFNVYVIDSLENSSIENLSSIKKVCSQYHNSSKRLALELPYLKYCFAKEIIFFLGA